MTHRYLTFEALTRLSTDELRDIARFCVDEKRYIPRDKDVIARGIIVSYLRDAVGDRTGTKDEVIRAAAIKVAKGFDIKSDDWSTMSDLELIERLRAVWFERFRRQLENLDPEQRQKLAAENRRQQEKRAQAAGLTGAAAAAGIVAAQMSGFGVYMATTTTIAAISSAIGVTFPFAVYQGATTALGVALGPVGWVMVGGTTAASAAYMVMARRQHQQAVILQTVVVGILLGLAPWLWYEVPVTATKAEVNKKFKRIARAMHPDTVSTDVPTWMLAQTTEWYITAVDYKDRIFATLESDES